MRWLGALVAASVALALVASGAGPCTTLPGGFGGLPTCVPTPRPVVTSTPRPTAVPDTPTPTPTPTDTPPATPTQQLTATSTPTPAPGATVTPTPTAWPSTATPAQTPACPTPAIETLFLSVAVAPPYQMPVWDQPGHLRIGTGASVYLSFRDDTTGITRWYVLTEVPAPVVVGK